MPEAERDLEVLLSYMLNRRVSAAEVAQALGVSKSTYHLQKREHRLLSPENLIAIARKLHLNPVDLLVQYRHITVQDVLEFASNTAS